MSKLLYVKWNDNYSHFYSQIKPAFAVNPARRCSGIQIVLTSVESP
ncbi:hypothetical protein HMPREF0208_02094 [Citrobacter koseri]|nr:hypothetical protein HMPREF3220_03448 [Citrobacter koseri]KXB44139.1 hypothetical protein HMPREF0208_02094 [Citrobacter koseri]